MRAVVETHQGTLTAAATSLAQFLSGFDPALVGGLPRLSRGVVLAQLHAVEPEGDGRPHHRFQQLPSLS